MLIYFHRQQKWVWELNYDLLRLETRLGSKNKNLQKQIQMFSKPLGTDFPKGPFRVIASAKQNNSFGRNLWSP